jgi:hypothetical protein
MYESYITHSLFNGQPLSRQAVIDMVRTLCRTVRWSLLAKFTLTGLGLTAGQRLFERCQIVGTAYYLDLPLRQALVTRVPKGEDDGVWDKDEIWVRLREVMGPG